MQFTMFIALAITAVVVVILFFNRINVKMSNVTEVREKIASYQKDDKAFKDEAEKITGLESRLKKLESQIITTDNLPGLLSAFEKLALDNNTQLQITSVQTPVVEEKTKLFVEFNVIGSYSDIQNYLSQTQKQIFQITITKIFLVSEKVEENISSNTGVLSISKTKLTPSKSAQWKAFVTIEVLSF
ncbi:MAG: hypothetical protein KBC11_02600 [Candidatus Pacebacteria bacterium]|nr:hypothetical protein [Candidatus Paceibacterota bacterium]